MSDSKTDGTQRKKIAKIIIDRPPLKETRLLLGLACGLAAGVIMGFVLWAIFEAGEGDAFPEALLTEEHAPYVWGFLIVGMLGGFVFGTSYGREVTARIEKVDAPEPTRRRRSTSTAIARVDISGRSRY